MNKEEFTKWFYTHVDDMVEAGILHPDSAAAKWVKLSLSAAMTHYESRINELENRLAELDGRKATPRPNIADLPRKQVPTKKPAKKIAKPVAKPETEKPVSKKTKEEKPSNNQWVV